MIDFDIAKPCKRNWENQTLVSIFVLKQPLPEKKVMSRDYKKTRSSSRRERAFVVGNILSFLSGLSLGLLVAFIVFLRYQLVEPDTRSDIVGSTPAENSQAQTDGQKPELEFTFYDTLRNKKINISEWVAGDKDSREEQDVVENISETQGVAESGEGDGTREQLAGRDRNVEDDVYGYVIQAGSFRDFNAADQVKAELALLGIFADIQRVMLNGQDVRHRVRLGPYKSVEEMRDIRRRLEDNRIEFMLLELRAEEDTT